MIRFRATDGQMIKMINNAVQESEAVGMGVFPFNFDTKFEMGDYIKIKDNSYVSIDYYEGRMVKLDFSRMVKLDGDVVFEINDWCEPRYDYQSWCVKYPTYRDLLESANIEIIEYDMKGE